jgi:Arc/MetJ-type ribon-helix-helix transcriptional regulator
MRKITFNVKNGIPERIDERIKKDFPQLRTVSDVIRAALDEFLQEEPECNAG